MKFNCIILLTGLVFLGCNQKELKVANQDSFDSQGHRGCRGLLPENTIPAFIKALELGVNTLEMDCVISADDKVIVSHEAFFNHLISTGPNGEEITEANEKEHNIHKLTYDEIKKYDVGMKLFERFPEQIKMEAQKPLLSDVVLASENYSKSKNRPSPFYNIEIKRLPELDGVFNPPVEKFVQLVVDQVYSLGIEERTTIQSFDLESLRITKRMKPEITTALLIENEEPAKDNIAKLGYQPEIYSCYFKLLNKEVVKELQNDGIKVIPWTVNSESDISDVIGLGVDGIISDYPDRVNKVLKQL